MNFPEELKYTKSHEWVRIEGNTATIGITDHAQSELGDIVFVELPEVGRELEPDSEFGTIEAVKTVADLYAPIQGKVSEVNSELADAAEIINEDPYGKGWIIKMEFEELKGELIDASAYQALIGA